MKLSRESEYGLQALLALARREPGTVVPLHELAAAGDLPQQFLAKTFQKLKRCGIVRSSRGRVRGYSLAREPEAVSLKEVLEAVEGTDLFSRCIFWGGHCRDTNPCLLHEQWKVIGHERNESAMRRLTLRDLLPAPAIGVAD
jgi:Rrf2 family protein